LRARGSRLSLPPTRSWPAVARALRATAGLSRLSPRLRGPAHVVVVMAGWWGWTPG